MGILNFTENRYKKRTDISLCILSGELADTKTSAENLFPLPICGIIVRVMQMDKEKELPKRKDIRLKNYDYSSPGAYFVTICTENRKNYFWNGSIDPQTFKWCSVGANCVRPQNLPLSKIGKIVLDELERWNQTYPAVTLYSYVIMPNHLHIMVIISADEYGRPQVAPTVERMVKQFKGAITKKVGNPIWQKSFIEHVIRNIKDYEARLNYIYENPIRWYYDELYTEE